MSSFGEELRRERELREISLREVAEATKVNLRYLEAMERNDFTQLPGGVFNRGFVRAYCDFIGVDAESMVNAYLLEEQAQAAGVGRDRNVMRGQVAGAQGRETGRIVERTVPASPITRWVVLAVVIGALVATFYLLIRLGKAEDGKAGSTSPPGTRRIALVHVVAPGPEPHGAGMGWRGDLG